MKQTYLLQPFAFNELASELKIVGEIDRNINRLAICYEFIGNLKTVSIASPSNTPTRKHQLWEETCFEFFLGLKNTDRYWEFNLSAAGHWNIYRFDRYRQGMQEETAFTTLPFIVEDRSNSLLVTLNLDLEKIVPANAVWQVAITSVIKDINGELTYWALTHKGKEADFHLRDSFAIELYN